MSLLLLGIFVWGHTISSVVFGNIIIFLVPIASFSSTAVFGPEKLLSRALHLLCHPSSLGLPGGRVPGLILLAYLLHLLLYSLCRGVTCLLLVVLGEISSLLRIIREHHRLNLRPDASWTPPSTFWPSFLPSHY